MAGKLDVSIVITSLLAAGINLWGQSCAEARPVALRGIVVDPSGGVIEAAQLNLSGNPEKSAVTNRKGEFVFECVSPSTAYRLHIKAEGFAPKTLNADVKRLMTVSLTMGQVKSVMEVDANEKTRDIDDPDAGDLVLNEKQLRGLADDPDDLRRQLQALAAAGGGIPGQAIVRVDGFQTDSKLPPKGSIAAVRINPDLYSAEYAKPPYQGGLIEILTKPAASPQGAVFMTESVAGLNANDTFSRSGTPASQRRYGFEFGAPILKNKSDFFIALEKREIHEFNVVNAYTLDSGGTAASIHQTVQAPRDLWVGSLRGSAQPNAKHTLVALYTFNAVSDKNQGVGGLVLPEAGYSSKSADQSLRLTDLAVLSSSLLNQARFSFTQKNSNILPVSNQPSLNVAGAFLGGGSTLGNSRTREKDLELSDDLSWTHNRHLLKVGANAMGFLVRNYDPSLFNGSFLFGGELLGADGGLTSIGGLEQYRLSLLPVSGALPTSYEVTRGVPDVRFSQWQVAFYAQDHWKARPGLSFDFGLRYALQTAPNSYANFAPRLGVAWAPGRKGQFVIRARVGLFYSTVDPAVTALAYRLDGTRQTQWQVYNPSFANPLSSLGGPTSVKTTRQLAAGLTQSPSFQPQIAIERRLPQQWQIQASLSYTQAWDVLRSRNINAPFVNADTVDPLLAPRPITTGKNILQFEQSGVLHGPVAFVGVSQHSYKKLGLFVGYLYSNLQTNADTPTLTPQSSYSNAGELARASWEPSHQVFAINQFSLFRGIDLSTQLSFSTGLPYDLLTGRDNNGDGVFNDRPSFATAPGPGVYATGYGLLSTTSINGTVQRNAGTMPALVHLDANVTRTFSLSPRGLAADRHQSVIVNMRVSNLLNHTNVTTVGNVVGSPAFGQAVTAEATRRIEFGIRYTF